MTHPVSIEMNPTVCFSYTYIFLCVYVLSCHVFSLVASFQFSFSLKVTGLHSNTLGRSSKGTSQQLFHNICNPHLLKSQRWEKYLEELKKKRQHSNVNMLHHKQIRFVSISSKSYFQNVCMYAGT